MILNEVGSGYMTPMMIFHNGITPLLPALILAAGVFLCSCDKKSDPYWIKAYGGNGWDRADSIQATQDGGFIVAGATSSFGVNPLVLVDDTGTFPEWEGTTDIWVLKLDGDGGIEWEKTYGSEGYEDFPKILTTDDGGYILAASSYSEETEDSVIWILKHDQDGEIVWIQGLGGDGSEYFPDIIPATDQGFILTIDTSSFGVVGGVLVVKLDSAGDIQWQKQYSFSDPARANSIQPLDDGGYIIAGNIQFYFQDNWDLWIMKIGADGSLEWSRIYDNWEMDCAHSIRSTSDGGYVVAGWAGISWILKLFSNGDVKRHEKVYQFTT